MQIGRHCDQKIVNVGVYLALLLRTFIRCRNNSRTYDGKTHKIGVIAGHPVPIVLAALNAFSLGIRSVDPKAHIQLVCTNSWNDPVTEVEATRP